MSTFIVINLHSQSAWTLQNSGVTSNLNSIFFVNRNFGFVVGDSGVILRTTDGGSNWEKQNSGVTTTLSKVWFTSASNGYIAGWNSVILKTTNSGDSWVMSNTGIDSSDLDLYAIQFANASVGWATGLYASLNSLSARIFKTTNAGGTWQAQQFIGYERFFMSISCIDTQTVWIAGELYGTIHTSNGGTTWTNQPTQSTRSVFFLDDSTGWATGDGLIVYRTTNGGTNWNTSFAGNISPLVDLHFSNNRTGWAVGWPSDSIAKTTDGGITWKRQFTNQVNSILNSVYFIDDSVGYSVGGNGIILKTTTGGELTNVKTAISLPNSVALYQNYPNPFNPSTTISFHIVHGSFVTLKIFDLLGREIRTLIAEHMNPGSYNRTFDASALPTGAYIYRLESDNYSLTKKLLIIK